MLDEQKKKPYMKKLMLFVKEQREKGAVFPLAKDIFNVFRYTEYNKIKVVILGQDPYHSSNTADGLAFSSKDTKTPPSLLNVFAEIKSDFYTTAPEISLYPKPFVSSNLRQWAAQGVFLLNTVMSVNKGAANSHQGKGWETFTASVVSHLSSHPDPLVFMLWGKNAKSYTKYITDEKHMVLMAAHPSPYSADDGFFGCSHFSRANKFINENRGSTRSGPGLGINWGVFNEQHAKQQYGY